MDKEQRKSKPKVKTDKLLVRLIKKKKQKNQGLSILGMKEGLSL